MTQIADKVYRNAKVYSIALDGKETHTEAVAIKDGKFVYVGDEAGLGDQIEGMVKELYAGKGAVRATLHKYVSAR